MVEEKGRLGRDLFYKECIVIVSMVCKKYLPTVPSKVRGKGDWFDAGNKEWLYIKSKRKEARVLSLDCGESVVLTRCHKRWNKLLVQLERRIFNAFWLQVDKEARLASDMNNSGLFYQIVKTIYKKDKKISKKGEEGDDGWVGGFYRRRDSCCLAGVL